MADDFSHVSWDNDPRAGSSTTVGDSRNGSDARYGSSATTPQHPEGIADPLDLAGTGGGVLECHVSLPIKENEGTKDVFVSYLVTTNTNFPSFAKPTTTVRRRFTDFVFLYNQLCLEYPACAVPPLPGKHKMEYVTGDRFSPDFTLRRASSLNRFLSRLALHPVLRRSALLIIFLESQDWNATMRSRPSRSGSGASDGGGASGVLDNITETFMNAFTKVHKPDKRFIEVRERADKLDEDLSHIEKIVSRVSRREDELQKDISELGENFKRLINLESGVEAAVQSFTASLAEEAGGVKQLRDHTDQEYLSSLRDMQAYSGSLKGLLRAREQKQVDFEQTTVLLQDQTAQRDRLSSPAAARSTTGFIRSKLEDVRGVDHEQSRRQRVRECEMRIEELTRAAEEAKRDTEAFDEEVVREVQDFERIKRNEFRKQLGGLCDAHGAFYGGVIETWERYVRDMEGEGIIAA